jgi:nitrous oxidase accessory protein
VGVDYPTIGAALKKANNGDVVEVKSGEYREEFRIEKAVHLKGINSPVIIGGKGHTIEIASRGVTVEGFVLKDENPIGDMNSAAIYISKGADDAVVKDNRFFNVMHAIWSVEARGARIENNTIEGRVKLERNQRGNGVYLTGCSEAMVVGNRMEHCRDGIYAEVSHDGKFIGNIMTNSRYGIHTMWVDRAVFSKNTSIRNLVGIAIMYSKNSVITDNVAAGNQTHGLLLNQTTRSRITGNKVVGNTKGVYFFNSIFNSLGSNLIMNNSLGLHSWGGSMDNTVNGNTFISNEVQVKYVAGRDQQWDGNYWSDYLGWDMDGDGIGDMPYETNSVVDHILWKYPTAKLLYASASLQLLWMMEKQFPILKVPKVSDTKPAMRPLQIDWRDLKVKYPYVAERYFGEIEKLPITH